MKLFTAIIIAGVLVLFVCLWWQYDSEQQEEAHAIAVSHMVPEIAKHRVSLHGSQDEEVAVSLIPVFVQSFSEWSHQEQAAFIKTERKKGIFTAERANLFRALIQDKSLNDVQRNNLGNTVLNGDPNEAELPGFFWKMAMDETEGERWRDYAIQFTGLALTQGTDNPDVRQQIEALIVSDGGRLSATALVQVGRMQAQSLKPITKDFWDVLWKESLEHDSGASLRLSALIGVMGRCKMTEYADHVRQALSSARSYNTRRMAAAALGDIGTVEKDKALLQALTKDSHKMVQMSAFAALKKLGVP